MTGYKLSALSKSLVSSNHRYAASMKCGQKVKFGLSLMMVASIIVLRGITIGQVSKQQIAAHRRHRQKRYYPYLVDVAQKETLANA